MRQRIVRSAALLPLFAAVFIHPVGAETATDTERCPIATDRLNRSVGYRSSNNVIKAPTTAEGTSALMKTVQNGEGEPRTIAIIRLALAGDLDTFRLLLGNADIDGVYIYASSYLNRDDTVCIDPELERVLLERLREPEMGHRLVALLAKNTYRNRSMLDALREVPLETTPRQANQYLAFGRAITSTHLPDIEADVLVHAHSLLPFDTPVKKNVLPGLHQYYAQFFTERDYAPTVAYFRELLMQADRNEPVESFQIKYGMLRTVVLRGLAELGGADAYAAIIGEIEAIAEKQLDPFSMSELETISKLAVTMPLLSDRDATVAAFERLLLTSQSQRYDYPMRRTIYRVLGELNTEQSQALLIAEIKRYFGNEPPPNRDAALAKLFESLRITPDLNIEPVLDLADESHSPMERRWIWGVAGAHPDEAGVDFLLAELKLSLIGGAEAERLLGSEASRVLLNMLAGMQEPLYQNQARDGIDDLFYNGALGDSDYAAAVTKLNKVLGNESPRYVAFREEQARQRAAEQADRQQAALEQGKREMQASFATELAQHSSADGIAADIEMLSAHGGEGKRAAQWLIIVGEPALAPLHVALAAADTDDRQRFQIMIVLGEIGSPDSIAPLIEAAETWGDGGFYRPAFFALALIPPTDEPLAFAYAQLVDGVPERRQIAGLVYLAQIRHAPAGDLVEPFTENNVSSRLRTAGFYLGARLGVPGIASSIEEELKQATVQSSIERSELDTLVQSLAEVSPSREEFVRVARSVGFTEQSFRYRQDVAYCAFRTAADAEKVELALAVLGNGSQWQRREAIRYLIATDPQSTVDKMTGGMGQYLPLHQLLRMSAGIQLLFSESRRMGYEFKQTGAGYVLIRPNTPSNASTN